MKEKTPELISNKPRLNDDIPEIKPIWLMIIILTYMHVGAVYGIYLIFTSAKISTTLYAIFLYQISIWGIMAGVHRLWSHRAYKAKWPLRLLLMIMFTTAYQHSVIKWARDHRSHHKYGDTNADPHNPKRGFFFAHLGWVLCRKHPDVLQKGKQIDCSDLYDDPIVKFQHDHIGLLSLLCGFLGPTITPMYLWNETLKNAFYVAVAFRWTLTTNVVALINSAAHAYGNKPYDENMSAAQHLTCSILASGEGWHNYHHAFPWDYQASELGKYDKYWNNTTVSFIDFFAWIGWAYDLKTVSPDMLRKRISRTGDGSHPVWGAKEENRLGLREY